MPVSAYKIKPKVKRFFDKFDKSQISKYAKFTTSVEKIQAVIEFAERLNIPESHLPVLLTKFRQLKVQQSSTPTTDEE